MITCPQCGSSSVLKDEAFHLAGKGGVMREASSLIRLGEHVVAGSETLLPVGHAQFGYGRGWWDEFWCLDEHGEGCWLSADEGEYAVERPLNKAEWPKGFRPRLGTHVRLLGLDYVVGEAETATCQAVRGEFPEELEIGETHLYFDLSGTDGGIATFETWDGGEAWTIGRWIDPWDVQSA